MWELHHKEGWAPKNWCFWTVVLEKTLESPLDCKEIQPVHPKGNHWKDWCWSWNSNTLATWYEELTHWRRSWRWERLKAGRQGDNRGWDSWMASPIWWTWVWVSSRSWWWTRKPGVLHSMGLQKVRHDWATELNWVVKYAHFQLYQVFSDWSLKIKQQFIPISHVQELLFSSHPCQHLVLANLLGFANQ